MSFAVAAVVTAAVGTAYGIYSSEEQKKAMQEQQKQVQREQKKIETENRNQEERMKATEERDRQAAALNRTSRERSGRAANILGSSQIGAYQGTTLLGG